MVTKWIDMPCYSRSYSKILFKPSVTNCHLIYYILIIRSGLVRHTPSTINKLDLFILYKFFHLSFLIISCLIPPSVKKCNLNNREFIGWIFAQLIYNSIDSILNSSKLSFHISSIIIIIYSFEPSNIIMRMRN